MPKTSSKKGLTLVEIVIAALVFAIFSWLLMLLYNRGSDSFRITVWKQNRNAELISFWAVMRKNLEEASNHYTATPGDANPKITPSPNPILIHPDPKTVDSGPILAWSVSSVNFDFTSGYFNHDPKRSTYVLIKEKKKLILASEINGKKKHRITLLDGVDEISFKVSSIVVDASDNEEKIVDGCVAGANGSLLEISIMLKPPEKYIAANQKLAQNNKFRLNVAPKFDSNPTYP